MRAPSGRHPKAWDAVPRNKYRDEMEQKIAHRNKDFHHQIPNEKSYFKKLLRPLAA